MASYPNPPPLPNASNSERSPEMVESEAEDQVDQLDSDSEAEGPGNEAPAKKNDPTGGQRTPGQTLLPAVRLENIIQAEGVTGSLALSKEGLFVLSVATEEFIKRMAEAGHLKATSERRTTVTYNDMAATTQQYQEFMFLDDTIPAPLSLVDALAMREEKEKELFDDDPAMSTISTPSARPSVKMGFKAQQSRNWVMINGQSHKNGSASASTSKRARRTERDDDNYGHHVPSGAPDPNRLWVEGSAARSASEHYQNGRSSAVPPPRQSSHSNGHSASSSRSGTATPKAEPPEHTSPRTFPQLPPRPSPLGPPEESWGSQYTGPASGFLSGPGAPFGHAAPNPGRTIYSQQHRTGS